MPGLYWVKIATAPMRYQIYPPPPALAHIVRFYWVYEIDGIAGQPYVYRSLASGMAEMVFHYKGQFSELDHDGHPVDGCSHLHAQTGKSRRFKTREDFGIFGAYLFPDALPQLTGYSAQQLTDQMPDLVAVWGAAGRILEDQIMTAPDDLTRCQLLSEFLCQRLAYARQPDLRAKAAIHAAIRGDGLTRVQDLAAAFNLSPRQLERQFAIHAGFSPKLFLRILRFQAAVAHFGDRNLPLTDIALACGYYDQAHFIHDFKQFSGYTPRAFFRGSPEGREFQAP
jgi:AraC-like DNA-binding protein